MAATVAPPPPANGNTHGPELNWMKGQGNAMAERNAGLKDMSACHGSQLRKRKKVQDDSLLGSLVSFICDHQIGLSVNFLLLLFLTHNFFPRARRRTTKFFQLSYFNPDNELYGCGIDDLYYVVSGTVIFTGLRVAVMEYILDPLARLGGIKSKKGLVRFKEQAWLVSYCTFSWSLGMSLIYNSEFWFNLHGLWHGWPFRDISGLFKWYYLVQWAFWLQQLAVVNIEEKRKDYIQMFVHHIFTCALIFLSYGYYHTRVGVLILTIMDLVDIVLPTAKLLKYLGIPNAVCDVAFALFMLVWVVTRHGFYNMVVWSVYAHAPIDIAPGCYMSDGTMVPASQAQEFEALGGNKIWTNLVRAYIDRTGTICWSPKMRFGFLAMLVALQVICILWFAIIVKIAYGVITGNGAEDARSDDEADDSEVDVEDDPTAYLINAAKTGFEFAPVEQEVGVEALTFPRRSSPGVRNYRRSNRSSGGRTSGISIPGHGDRKELLGRIGCDKPT